MAYYGPLFLTSRLVRYFSRLTAFPSAVLTPYGTTGFIVALMSRNQYDAVIIGVGMAGMSAARRLLVAGKKVAVVDSMPYGGNVRAARLRSQEDTCGRGRACGSATPNGRLGRRGGADDINIDPVSGGYRCAPPAA